MAETQRAGIPNFTGGEATAITQQHNPYIFRTSFTQASAMPKIARYITDKLKAKTVAVIDDNEEYSLGIADIVRSTLKADGITVAVTDHIDKNAQDYSATVNKIKPANVDAIFYGGYYSEGGRFLKQIRDVRLAVQ